MALQPLKTEFFWRYLHNISTLKLWSATTKIHVRFRTYALELLSFFARQTSDERLWVFWRKKKWDIVYIISFQVTLTRKIQYFDIIWFIIHHTTHVNKHFFLFIMAYSMIHWSMPQGSLQNPSHLEKYNLVISHTACFYYSILQQHCYVVFFFKLSYI